MKLDILTSEDGKILHEKLDHIITKLEDQDLEFKASQLYTNEQLAIKLGVSKKTLQNWRDSGKINYSKVGRKIFYTQEHLLAFLNNYSFNTF